MKLCLAVLFLCFIYVQSQGGHGGHGGHDGGFIFGGLFENGCQDDSSCNGGCCVMDAHGHGKCHHHVLKYLEPCHLSGIETYTCGCGKDHYCERLDRLSGPNIALEGSLQTGMGVCERGANYTTTQAPLVAVEGGR